jgi:hypothetical protein
MKLHEITRGKTILKACVVVIVSAAERVVAIEWEP